MTDLAILVTLVVFLVVAILGVFAADHL